MINALLLQALDALQGANGFQQDFVADAIEVELAKPQAEPVAWTTMPGGDSWEFVSGSSDPNGQLSGKWSPLYAAPQAQLQAAPLTDDQIKAAYWGIVDDRGSTEWFSLFARAIERAHGIGEAKP